MLLSLFFYRGLTDGLRNVMMGTDLKKGRWRMRDQILNWLRESRGEPISGEAISKRFGVTRAAIWKHIQALKDEGYQIETVARKGYRLAGTPDRLLPAEVLAGLKTRWLGKQIIYHDHVTSTNDVAKRAAFDGCAHGTVVVAEAQGEGRGRLSRGWFSPHAKGVWFSCVFRPAFLPQQASKCTLMAAVALARAFERYPGVNVGIKWPNDILSQEGKKLVGILAEMNAEMDAINFIVIGMGINVNLLPDDFPEELQPLATSLQMLAGGAELNRKKLLQVMLEELEAAFDEVSKNGFDALLEEWRKRSITLGRQVNVIAPDETYSGLALDIDQQGALLVRRDSNGAVEQVWAGDVSIRPVRPLAPQG